MAPWSRTALSVLSGALAGAHIASGAEVLESVTGKMLPGQTDLYGIFGPVGTDLSDKPFTLTFAYDPSIFTQVVDIGPNSYVYFVPTTAAAGALQVSLTIGSSKTVERPNYTAVSGLSANGGSAAVDCCATPTEPNSYGMAVNASKGAPDYQHLEVFYSPLSTSASLLDPSSPAPGTTIKFWVGQELATYYGVVGDIPGIYFQKNPNAQPVNVADTAEPVPVVVGQQILLTASPANGNWVTPFAGSPVGGYQGSAVLTPSYCITNCVQSVSFTQSSAKMYWLTSGLYTVKYMYQPDGGGSPVSLTANFSVSGPEGVKVNPPVSNTSKLPFFEKVQRLECGTQISTCAVFKASYTNLPSVDRGVFEWVQVLNNYEISGYLSGQVFYQVAYLVPALDNDPSSTIHYPYERGIHTADAPAVPLESCMLTVKTDFSATMYLLWDSRLPSSIPGPLGYVNWSWKGAAKLDDSVGKWRLSQPDSVEADAFVPATDFPNWSTFSVQPPDPCKAIQ